MTKELNTKLNYVFRSPELLKTALTHRSKGGEHNERLEFLGDAVVNFVIADILYHHFPEATEGELSRFRASLVNRGALADLAKDFDLGDYIILGTGELKSGGSQRESILSCAMEALIGAIYLDGGFEEASACIKNWYGPTVKALTSASHHKDAKTLLQEFLQSKKFSLPIYTVESIEGEAHQQVFTVSCVIEGFKDKTFGRGTSRRRAEQDAAQMMLALVEQK